MTDQTNATGHTPEPWIRKPVLSLNGRTIELDDIDYARAELCVNALAGISDPAAFVKQAKEAAAAVQAERERCLAWVEQLIKDNQDIIRRLGHGRRMMENEHSIEDLALIRERITSGEALSPGPALIRGMTELRDKLKEGKA